MPEFVFYSHYSGSFFRKNQKDMENIIFSDIINDEIL